MGLEFSVLIIERKGMTCSPEMSPFSRLVCFPQEETDDEVRWSQEIGQEAKVYSAG